MTNNTNSGKEILRKFLKMVIRSREFLNSGNFDNLILDIGY